MEQGHKTLIYRQITRLLETNRAAATAPKPHNYKHRRLLVFMSVVSVFAVVSGLFVSFLSFVYSFISHLSVWCHQLLRLFMVISWQLWEALHFFFSRLVDYKMKYKE